MCAIKKDNIYMFITIGTRSSPLALYQAHLIQRYIKHIRPEAETRIAEITTTGDRLAEKNVADLGGKGVFVKEIEEALLNKDIDIAAHSLKDMPADLPEGLRLGCFLPREDARDVLVSNKGYDIDSLPFGATAATSSPRRAAWLLHRRPDIHIVPFRGNVQTRIRKLEAGAADVTFLAAAGLKRLELWEEKKHMLIPVDTHECIPAPGQGIITAECRKDDTYILSLLQEMSSPEAECRARCERAFLAAFGEGSCTRPVGGYAQLHHGMMRLYAVSASSDGAYYMRVTETGTREDAVMVGDRAGQSLLSVTKKIIEPHEKTYLQEFTQT